MPKTLTTIRLEGTQTEMGARHGQQAASDARRLFEFYRAMPERVLAGDMRGPGAAIGRWVARQLAGAWQGRLVRERKFEDAERTRAFIEAAGHAEPGAERALATMDVMQNCIAMVAKLKLGPFARRIEQADLPLRGLRAAVARLATRANARTIAAAIPACSTAIAWGEATEDGELLFARNFDFPGIGVWDAAPAFVQCVPDRGQAYGFFATRGADTAVVTVVNEAGLVLAPHTRWHRDVSWGGAMIVDVVHDIARRAETLEDAIRIARERPISSSWGLAVGSAREKSALVIEIAGPHVEIVRPEPGASFLVCANRYRSPKLQAGQFAGSTAWSEHSERRERRLRELVEARAKPLVAQDLARMLGDRRDVCEPSIERRMGATLSQTGNVHCAVVQPAQRRAWVGVDAAPSCLGAWTDLAWDWRGDAITEPLPEFVAAHDEATRHVHDAVRAHDNDHDLAASRIAIERAVTAAPDDPSLRLAAAWLAMEDRDFARGTFHVEHGLATETESLRRAQLLLWGARAAKRNDDRTRAAKWTDELLAMSGEHVDELREAVAQRHDGRPHVNLLMVDAY